MADEISKRRMLRGDIPFRRNPVGQDGRDDDIVQRGRMCLRQKSLGSATAISGPSNGPHTREGASAVGWRTYHQDEGYAGVGTFTNDT